MMLSLLLTSSLTSSQRRKEEPSDFGNDFFMTIALAVILGVIFVAWVIVIPAIAGLPDLHPEPWMITRNAKPSKSVWLLFDLPRINEGCPVTADFISHVAVMIAIGAVAVVLLLGLINMRRGGPGNTSQKLMRLRVLL